MKASVLVGIVQETFNFDKERHFVMKLQEEQSNEVLDCTSNLLFYLQRILHILQY